jgi:hypothetical protein
MPRYFFHDIDRHEKRDTEGTELAGVAEARAEAVVVAGEMLKELGAKFWNSGTWHVLVEDEPGRKLCTLSRPRSIEPADLRPTEFQKTPTTVTS